VDAEFQCREAWSKSRHRGRIRNAYGGTLYVFSGAGHLPSHSSSLSHVTQLDNDATIWVTPVANLFTFGKTPLNATFRCFRSCSNVWSLVLPIHNLRNWKESVSDQGRRQEAIEQPFENRGRRTIPAWDTGVPHSSLWQMAAQALYSAQKFPGFSTASAGATSAKAADSPRLIAGSRSHWWPLRERPTNLNPCPRAQPLMDCPHAVEREPLLAWAEFLVPCLRGITIRRPRQKIGFPRSRLSQVAESRIIPNCYF